ncbi:MAG: hypothetical protein KBC33_02985 [Candidatus Pacebacteria bacterium]|nr:hypothetical protein [Candidatus Paceibacterota bacterium]
MRRKYFIILAVFVTVFLVTTHIASAFTINRSIIRRLFAPQISSNTLAGTTTPVDFFLGKNIRQEVLSGSSVGTTSIKDVIYDYFATGSVENKCDIFIQNGWSTPVYSAVHPSIATVDQNGSTTYVSNGSANFNVRVGKRTRTVACDIFRTVDSVSYVYDSIIPTSTVHSMIEEIDTRLNGETPSATTYNIYSSVNDMTHEYTRNVNSILADLDLTCIPVLSGAISSAQTMGVLVAPDIMIQANHSHPSGTMYFVKADNTTVSRSIVSGTTIPNTDIYVAKLDSPVPAGINPCKVFPPTVFTNYISTTSAVYAQPPVFFTNQHRMIRVGTINQLIMAYGSKLISIVRGVGDYYNWYTIPCCGDSGSPAFTVINGEPVILGVWYSAYSVPSISDYTSEINAAITSLGSAYSLTSIDLSSFSSF